MSKNAALVLAAGKGTRMHSEKPKVLQTLLECPMLAYVYQALTPLFGDTVWTVIGAHAEMVRAAFPDKKYVLQEELAGTGDALRCALPALSKFDRILVVNGDAPLIRTDILSSFLDKAGDFDLAFATAELSDPKAYGRVIRREGKVTGIVEAKNYDTETMGPPSGEINVGLYVISYDLALSLVPKIERNALSREFYITDLVALALAAGYRVDGIVLGRDTNLLGVNTPRELSMMEEYKRAQIVDQLIDSGVVMHAPDLVRIGPFVEIEPGAEITGPCEVYGKSRICAGARVSSHCVIRDSVIESNARIHEFSHLDCAHVGRKALVGPYARLRPGAELCEQSHVGNFVELKKARLGFGAKANHLTYLGDAEIGAGTNIGAGTITCNYDGVNKHKTVIGDTAFIGSNTALVAPVTIGEGALIGAGSTITRDVPAGSLAVARGKQKVFAERLRKTVVSMSEPVKSQEDSPKE
ncbi:MAG: bifunctional UDP-N-acetylglucosamine diphosphorylase/glucosamine-1-phosphate N-acetyltransferase GlmU [Desulfovibrionaceae bacterium]|nr:bifunctional UDP-N-acetylglucosamine diphosphorylase/glucosamine-1-phosphate N-acetyltransferase GlmU [Desulfovibrionaceae bacterium]